MKMEAKDTVMKDEEIMDAFDTTKLKPGQYNLQAGMILARATRQVQAEISFKAGIQEVVELLHWDIKRQVSKDGETVIFKLPAEVWQSKLEEWDITKQG